MQAVPSGRDPWGRWYGLSRAAGLSIGQAILVAYLLGRLWQGDSWPSLAVGVVCTSIAVALLAAPFLGAAVGRALQARIAPDDSMVWDVLVMALSLAVSCLPIFWSVACSLRFG